MGIGLISSLIFSLFVYFPQLDISNMKSFLYFGDVSNMPEDEFIDSLKGKSKKQIYKEIASQIHATSIIANDKFKNTKKAINFMEKDHRK